MLCGVAKQNKLKNYNEIPLQLLGWLLKKEKKLVGKKILNHKSDFNLDVLLFFRIKVYSFPGHKLAAIKELVSTFRIYLSN